MNKGILTFPKCINLKIITQLEFELAYDDVAVQHVIPSTPLLHIFHLWHLTDEMNNFCRLCILGIK